MKNALRLPDGTEITDEEKIAAYILGQKGPQKNVREMLSTADITPDNIHPYTRRRLGTHIFRFPEDTKGSGEFQIPIFEDADIVLKFPGTEDREIRRPIRVFYFVLNTPSGLLIIEVQILSTGSNGLYSEHDEVLPIFEPNQPKINRPPLIKEVAVRLLALRNR